MDLRFLLLLACLPALAGCSDAGGGGDDGQGGAPTPDAGPDGAGDGAEQGGTVEVASAEFQMGPVASNAVPNVNGTVTLAFALNQTWSRVVVNTTVTMGSSVNLHFYDLGPCAGAIESPARPGATYTHDCGPVPPGTYNLTYAQDSGTVAFRVQVFGVR